MNRDCLSDNVDKEYGRHTHVNINIELDFILLIWRMVLGSRYGKNKLRSSPTTCTDRREEWGVAY